MTLTVPSAAFPSTWIHTQKQLRRQQLQQHVWGTVWLLIGWWRWCWLWCWGSSWQTCPGWRAEAPIFTPTQHPHITTAVPTSLVCPMSGIAGLSERSPTPRLCCFPFHFVSPAGRSDLLDWTVFDLIADLWERFGYRSCGITSLTGRTVCDNLKREAGSFVENSVGPP